MPKKSKTSTHGESFAQQYAELEKIVADFERDGMHLDEGLKQFERGLKIAGALRTTLTEVENSIEKLKKQYHLNDDGTQTEPPEPEAN